MTDEEAQITLTVDETPEVAKPKKTTRKSTTKKTNVVAESPEVIDVEIAKTYPTAILPIDLEAYAGDAGTPIFATEDVRIPPKHNRMINAKVAMDIPDGAVGLICTRSGMAKDYMVQVLNAPGIVDPNYTGDIQVNLMNHNPQFVYAVKRGDNIAQLLLIPFYKPNFIEKKEITKSTDRGTKGHGSSGK
jgi:dUTP pyrophosphatase